MPSATITRIRKANPTPTHWLRWIGVVLIVAVVTIGGAKLLQGPKFVPHLTIENPSPYTIEVQVSGAGGDGWTLLGPVEASTTTSVDQIIEQGERWVFRTYAQGVPGGDFTIPRSDLAGAGWHVTIPSSVIERLRAQHISASPTAN